MASHIDRAENLAAALDDFAIDGFIEPQAIATFVKAHRSSVVVNQATNSLELNGKPLREGIKAILDKEPFWKPRGGEENHQREKVEADVILENLKKAALSGNVTAHGRLRVNMGTDLEYQQWCAETGAAPGKTILLTEVNGEMQHSVKKPNASNPWSKAGWNFTEQMRLYKTLGPERATEIAAAAGCVPGKSTKPNPEFN